MEKEKNTIQIESLKATDTKKLQDAMLLMLKSLGELTPEQEQDDEFVRSCGEYLADIVNKPGGYVGVVCDENEEVIGAIDGHNAINEKHREEDPDKIPVSAINKMGTTKDKIFYIDTISTEKKHEGEGIGSQLLKAAEEYAKNGYEWVFLRTDDTPENKSVCEFYKRKDYIEFGHLPDAKESKTHFGKKLTPESEEISYEVRDKVSNTL